MRYGKRPVLVTGGAGYIGSHACKYLDHIGYFPVVLDNLSTGHREFVKWGPLVEGDIGNAQLLRQTVRDYSIQSVIHFAASAYVGESIQNPRKYFLNNMAKGISMMEALLDGGVQNFVFSSSCASYGLPSHIPISENDPQHPINPYGDSKLFFEKVLKWYAQAYPVKWVALRYFNAAGDDPDLEVGERHDPETHLIPLVIRACLGINSHVEVLGTDYETPDGTAIRDYVHVSDLASAHALALDYLIGGNESGAFNLGIGRGYSVREVIQAVEKVGGRPCPVQLKPRRRGDPPVLVGDATRARQVLGWQPRYQTVDEIVATAWKWHSLTDLSRRE